MNKRATKAPKILVIEEFWVEMKLPNDWVLWNVGDSKLDVKRKLFIYESAYPGQAFRAMKRTTTTTTERI